MLEPYATLFQHEAWADWKLLQTIAGHAETAGDETVRKRLRHAHVVQRGFLAYLEGDEPDMAAIRKPFESLEAYGVSLRDYQGRVIAAVKGLDGAALARTSKLAWLEGDFTLAEMMLQMTLHSHHHRGQNLLRMRQLGGEPPTLDLILWVAEGRPAPAW